MPYENGITFLAGLVLMSISSRWAVKYAIGLSQALALQRFAVGFIFIAIATTFPELFVSLSATFHGEPGLAVGNALGSVFANLSIILGMAVLIGGTLKLRKGRLGELIEILFVSSLASLFLIQTGSLTYLQGLILFALFAVFIVNVKKERIEMGHRMPLMIFFRSFLLFILSVAVLLVSSDMIVRSAVAIVAEVGVVPEFIGLTVIAIGTSLPELSVAIHSIKSKEYELALGDLFGASVIDMTFIMGLIAMLNPVPINLLHVSGVLPFMLTAIMANWYLLSRGLNVTRRVAFALIGLYAVFILEQIGLVTLFA